MIFSDICKRVGDFVVFVGFSVRQRRAFACFFVGFLFLSLLGSLFVHCAGFIQLVHHTSNIQHLTSNI